MKLLHYKIVKRCDGTSVASFCFLVYFFLFFNYTLYSFNGPKDSLKRKYQFYDPGSPNCPCYKYQKKADKEFLRKREKEKNDLSNLDKSEKKISIAQKVKRCKNIKLFFGKKRNKKNPVMKKQNRKKFIFRKDISACPRL